MNPNFNWAIAAERMQAVAAEADTAARARHAARIRRGTARARLARAGLVHRSRRGLAFRSGRLRPVAPSAPPAES